MRKDKESKIPAFTERIRELVNSTNVTVTKFAEDAGITRQALNSYLNDNRVPGSEALTKICSAYHVSADWLLGVSDGEAAITTESPFRKRAVETVKLMGQELIDRADELIPRAQRVKEINIRLRIPTKTEVFVPPEIQVDVDVYPSKVVFDHVLSRNNE